MKEKVMQGKPYAGNPHVRFDEGADVSARPVRSALLYKKSTIMVLLGVCMSGYADFLEVNVPEGVLQTGFTEAQLSAIANLTAADEIKKTGPGTLSVVSIAKIGYFEGVLRISDGVYQLGTPVDGGDDYWNGHTGLGHSGKAQVIVDGTGTLFTDQYLAIDRVHMYANTKLCLSGNGYNGQGAFVVGGKTGEVNNNFYLAGWHISLAGDATIVKGGSPGAYSAGACTWDLNGYTLTLKNGFDIRTHELAGNERDLILSSGRIVVDGKYKYTLSPVLLGDGVDGEFACCNGASVTLTETSESDTIYDWTNAVPPGTTLELDKTTIWKGPYSLSDGATVRLKCAAGEDCHIYNHICGDANVESVGETGSRIYLHGHNTYSGTTKLYSGALIFMSKDAAPGWDGDRLLVDGEQKFDRIFAFAQQTADRQGGWTGSEMWDIIKLFLDKKWSVGAYVDAGDDFKIPGTFDVGRSFKNMNFTSFGGGRAVFTGRYPENFDPFNLENNCSNIVYSVLNPSQGTTILGQWWLGTADITFENMGYCFLGSYKYLYAHGAEASGCVGRLTIGAGTCIDISSDSSSGRPFCACGNLNGRKGVVTLLDGAVASNGVWVAVSDSVSNQCGSYIQRGGEMRMDKGCANFRIGGAANSMAYAEIGGGVLSSANDAYLGPLYNTCISPTAGVAFRQKGGTADFDCTLNMPLAGRGEMRLSGGKFRAANCFRAPNCDNENGAYGGEASVVAESGAQPLFAGGIILADRIGSTGVVEAVSRAMVNTPWIKKAATTGKGSLPTGDNLAVVNFNGGGMMAIQDGAELLGSGDEQVDFAVVHAGGAFLGASNGVTASISVPLVPPSGMTVASVSIPSGVPVSVPASGVVRISGDGVGATASAEFDSTKWCERITSITVHSGGSGYTSAKASLFVGGGIADIPLDVSLAPAVKTGGVVKKGPGTVVLNAVNGYGGDTVVEEGTLRVAVAGAIPSGSGVKIKDGGLLEMAAGVPYPGTIVADIDFDSARKYPLVKVSDGRGEAPDIGGIPTGWHLVRKGNVWTAAVQRGMRLILR